MIIRIIVFAGLLETIELSSSFVKLDAHHKNIAITKSIRIKKYEIRCKYAKKKWLNP